MKKFLSLALFSGILLMTTNIAHAQNDTTKPPEDKSKRPALLQQPLPLHQMV